MRLWLLLLLEMQEDKLDWMLMSVVINIQEDTLISTNPSRQYMLEEPEI